MHLLLSFSSFLLVVSRGFFFLLSLSCLALIAFHCFYSFLLLCNASQMQEQRGGSPMWPLRIWFPWVSKLPTMWLQWGRNWGRSMQLFHRTMSVQGEHETKTNSPPPKPFSWIDRWPKLTHPATIRRTSRVLAVTSAELAHSTWTPPTPKAAPAASASVPRIAAGVQTRDTAR